MSTQARIPSAPLVAIAGWLLPGSGYLLLGQRGRGVTIGTTVLSLFILGLLIAGVRVIEVPGYDDTTGDRQMFTMIDPQTQRLFQAWILEASPLTEIRNKPWSVPQAMAGPVAVLASIWSVQAAGIDPVHPGHAIGELSHARLNEIGSLYLSVAGLLNLMAIIDSSWRASYLNQQQADRDGAA